MERLWQDLRYGFRMLLKSPGFTVVAILSLALGIGANTAIFSVLNSFLLAPLPVERPTELVSIFTTDTKNPGNLPVSHWNFKDFREKNAVFTDVTAFTPGGASMTVGKETTGVGVNMVAGNYFDVLGVRAMIGRTFLPDEDKTPDTSPVVVLSYGTWQRNFGGNPNIVNSTIVLNRQPFTVVGVTPQDFEDINLGGGPDMWSPIMMHNVLAPGSIFFEGRRGLAFFVVGRLKPGVQLSQAQAAMTTLATQLEQEYKTDNGGRNVRLIPLLQARLDPTGDGQLMLQSILMMSIVGVVLLIACANVANLLLARATKRQREIAIRLSIGASRSVLIRQLMTESLLLSIIGGLVGFLVAFWSRDLISSFLPFGGGGPNTNNPNLNPRVLLFTFALSIISGLIFGLVPALQASKPDLVPTLKGESTLGSRRGGFRINLRHVLVVLQVSLSLVSLVGAGLLVRSLQKAQEVDPGFRVDNVLLINVNVGAQGYKPEQGKVFYQQLLDRVRATAGVKSAAIAQNGPFGGGIARSVFLEGADPTPGNRGVLVQLNTVGSKYFDTMGIPIVRGRDFSDTDTEMSPKVVIVNEVMANRFWPGVDPIGKRFKFFGEEFYREVAGVSKNTKVNSLTEAGLSYIYVPLTQNYTANVTLHVQTVGDPAAMTSPLRGVIQSLDANLQVQNVRTVRERVTRSLGGQYQQSQLMTFLGFLALLLASIGLYGVMAYSVAQRTREIGIRMALGANRIDVLKLILGHALLLVSIGIGLGLAVAAVLSQTIKTLLFGISAADPITYVGTSVVLALVALLASYIPARRATKVNAQTALRAD